MPCISTLSITSCSSFPPCLAQCWYTVGAQHTLTTFQFVMVSLCLFISKWGQGLCPNLWVRARTAQSQGLILRTDFSSPGNCIPGPVSGTFFLNNSVHHQCVMPWSSRLHILSWHRSHRALGCWTHTFFRNPGGRHSPRPISCGHLRCLAPGPAFFTTPHHCFSFGTSEGRGLDTGFGRCVWWSAF